MNNPHFLVKLRVVFSFFFFLSPSPFFVQPRQIPSKLNYVAICCVFDVINLKPYWNVHRLEGLWATINAVVLYEFSPPTTTTTTIHPLHPPSVLKTEKDETVAGGLFCIKVLRSESGGFLIGADYTAVATKMMTIQE